MVFERLNESKNEALDINYYKSELQKTVDLVRSDYKRILDENRQELETFYRANLERLEAESKRRRERIEQENKNASEIVLLKSYRLNFTDDLSQLKNKNTQL